VPVVMMSPASSVMKWLMYRNEVSRSENHCAGVAAWSAFRRHVEPHVERLGVHDLVGGDEPGPHRAEGLSQALAAVPLAAALELELPPEISSRWCSPHVVERLRGSEAYCAFVPITSRDHCPSRAWWSLRWITSSLGP